MRAKTRRSWPGGPGKQMPMLSGAYEGKWQTGATLALAIERTPVSAGKQQLAIGIMPYINYLSILFAPN